VSNRQVSFDGPEGFLPGGIYVLNITPASGWIWFSVDLRESVTTLFKNAFKPFRFGLSLGIFVS
jgi:hypothetical protein